MFNLNVTSSTQHQTPFVPKSALISKRKNGELENAYDFVNDLGNEFPIEYSSAVKQYQRRICSR